VKGENIKASRDREAEEERAGKEGESSHLRAP